MSPSSKQCSKCGEVKTLEVFSRDRRTRDGRMSWCKACHAEYLRTPGYRELKRRYDQSVAGRGSQRQYRHSEIGRKTHREAVRRHNQTVVGRVAKVRRSHARRARKAQVGGILTLTVLNLVSLQGGVCAYCERPFSDVRPPTIDHVIPLSRGGTNDDSNVVAACRSCNSSKGSRTAVEFQEVGRVSADD